MRNSTTKTYTKYEILAAVAQSAHNGNVGLDTVQKFLRKIKAKTDKNGEYTEEAKKAAVLHFSETRKKQKEDKLIINLLHDLQANIAELKQAVTKLNSEIDNDKSIAETHQKAPKTEPASPSADEQKHGQKQSPVKQTSLSDVADENSPKDDDPASYFPPTMP